MHKTESKPTMPSQPSFYVTLFCVLCLSFCLPETAWSADQVSSQQQLDQLKKNITKVNRWLERANIEKSGLSKQLETQEKKIDQISKKIRANNAEIAQRTKKLGALNTQRKQQNAALKQQTTFLIKQLRAAYLQGNQPALKMLLDADDPQNMARYMHYFSYINDARNTKIDAFQSSLAELKNTENKILRQQTELTQSRQTLEKNRQSLQHSRTQRQKVLAKLEKNIRNNSQRLSKMKADQSRLEKLLTELEQAIANIPLPNDATPFKQQKSKLPWPSRGKVIARFGSRIAQGKLRLNGIRIATKEDTEIFAVHYGRVIFSNWIRGFGLLIIIDHGDNYMSLYGNNKSLRKETGDWVSAGEVIAYASESSAKIESGLYFEIRKNGKPENPSRWLRK